MEAIKDEVTEIKELLRHAGEFVAYMEVAEIKMIGWQEQLEQRTLTLEKQAEILKNEFDSVAKLFSEVGIPEFRKDIENALTQGESNLRIIEHNANQFTQSLEHQQHTLNSLTTQCLEKIESHAIETRNLVASQFSKYDIHQFHRIASESCDHVERAAKDAVAKSNKLLSTFQLRFGGFTLLLSLMITFLIVLYLSDELPWEMHHQAVNERQAGKVLLQAWPKLSQAEKAKILNDEAIGKG